jgi:hypothetical protein
MKKKVKKMAMTMPMQPTSIQLIQLKKRKKKRTKKKQLMVLLNKMVLSKNKRIHLVFQFVSFIQTEIFQLEKYKAIQYQKIWMGKNLLKK